MKKPPAKPPALPYNVMVSRGATPNLKGWGVDHDTHHLLEIRTPPPSLVALRQLLALPENEDIAKHAILGNDFEECMGRIAEKLDIALDGLYDPADLCDLLASAMRSRHTHKNQPHLRDKRLVNAELVEKAKSLELVETKDGTIAPTSSPLISQGTETKQ